jgi:aryl-alcohol dehydrogenase-like predicted oxidoreductase
MAFALKTTNIGNTSLRTSRIGCGLIRIGRSWGKPEKPIPSQKEALAFLEHAVRKSVNFFDTAPAYGHSEARLGRFLKSHPELRDQLVIASKCGEGFDLEKMQPLPRDYSPDAIRASIERSLSLLGRIDLMQIHSVTPEIMDTALSSDKGILKVLRGFQNAGDIGHLGFTASSWDRGKYDVLEQALRSGHFATIQVPYNLSDASMELAIKLAIRNDVGVITNRPLGSGILVERQRDAIRFLFYNPFIASSLIGTASQRHLDEALNHPYLWEAI